MQDFKYIGKSIIKYDVNPKVDGRMKYIADIKFENMLYAKLILAKTVHANIKRINTEEAVKVEGVVKIYTYKDIPKNYYSSHRWYEELESPMDELLISDKVRFYGDRIGIVVAKDKKSLQNAIDLIEIEYDELDSILTTEDALKESALKIQELGNLAFEKEINVGNVNEIFNKDDVLVVEDVVSTPRQHHGAIETHVTMCDIDINNNITVYSGCQTIFQIQMLICEILNLSRNSVRVIKMPLGGSFGGKGQPVLEPICAFLAYDLKVPIQLLMDREDVILGTRVRNPIVGKIRTAVDNDGNILGRDLDMTIDIGAYYTNASAIAMTMGKKFNRLYRVGNQRYKVKSVHTNTLIGGACRGYGSPQIHTITEINIDNVAKRLKMDPVEFRLKNLVHPYDKDPLSGLDLGNTRAVDCVRIGRDEFNWDEKYNKTKTEGRYKIGVGTAIATHGNGYYNAYPDFTNMNITINKDGQVIVKSAIHDMGCGTVTTIAQIVAEVIDISPKKVIVYEGDTHVTPYDSAGTQASRVTYVNGKCAEVTARLFKERFIEQSSRIFECKVEEIIMEDGLISNIKRPEEKFSYGDMVKKVEHKLHTVLDITNTYKSTSNPAVNAANFVEVEVDTLTGLVKVLDVLAVHDIGRAINKGLVEGQIQGGAHMSIGMALSEEVEIDKKGIVKSRSFSKYHMLNTMDMPDVRCILVEEGGDFGPFEAKSVGEIASSATAAAVINAINNALDTNITTLPATPERILEAIYN